MRRVCATLCAVLAGAATVPPIEEPWRVSETEWQTAQQRVPTILRNVKPEYRERCDRVLRNLPDAGFAQAWQDHFLWRNFFANMRRDGLYLDIGTNDAIDISNTVFFDVCLGWTGVCFEPQRKYHSRIRAKRSCELVPSCVMGKPVNVTAEGDGELMHLVADPVGGGKDRGSKGRGGKGRGSKGRGGTTMQCVGLRESLVDLKLESRVVDLISIDIEGNEPGVLKCLPWDKIDVRMVLIETNKYRDLRPVDMFFHAHGYVNARAPRTCMTRADGRASEPRSSGVLLASVCL